MVQPCVKCVNPFEIADEDLQFYENVSPIFGEQKYLIPPPTHCPDCRQQRRLASCNEQFLYRGRCGLCGKNTLTQYPPGSDTKAGQATAGVAPSRRGQPYYCRECWHSDDWDPCSYGRDVDFTRPFFEQFQELQKQVPAQALHIDGTCLNSEYIHYAGSSKNCYLIAHADFCDECYYGYGFKNDVSCVDGFYNLHCELCYDGVDIHKCYDLKASQDCISCSSSAFLRDCIGCKNCFLCVGLRNKEYCFENKQLTKEAYYTRLAEVDTGSHQQYQACQARLRELEKQHAFKAFHGHNLENSFGDYLYNCKNTQFCFDCEEVESAKYCYQMVLGSKDIYDIYQFGTNLQASYECAISGANGYGILFTMNAAMQSTNLLYCYYMESSKNCFGCTSMHHKQYCILNKQYTKEEYEELVPKIIQHMSKRGRAHSASAQAERESGFASSSEAERMHQEGSWGEFFPINISLFGYNKTTAQMYYPLTREQALAQGFPWDDYEPPQPQATASVAPSRRGQVEKILRAQDLPDTIQDISDDILSAAIECEVTHKLFKITPQELAFYRRQKIPLPRRHPDQRHLDRFHKRNKRQFWQRACAKCQQPIWTTYSPDQPETVYCEKCYLERTY